MKIQETRFQYEGIDITFQGGSEENVMINATEMAVPFSKNVHGWTRLRSTKAFMQVLEDQRNVNSLNGDAQLVRVSKGGDETTQGTWMHEDVAIEFARWLSPAFGIWCNARIKELIMHKVTALNPEELLKNPDFIIEAMQEVKKSRELTAIANAKLEAQAPKVEYFETFIDSTGLFSLNEAAKMLSYNRNIMMSRLRDVKVLMKNSFGNNIPYQKYITQNYFDVKTIVRGGRSMSTTLVTSRGVEFIRRKLSL